mmetsp:Transcript_26725/g.59380  ORF Transcript_26725/g.59380 Transcript_26725/m.59380 type:complete len:526 (-) Transcript_26725:72-1649(-)
MTSICKPICTCHSTLRCGYFLVMVLVGLGSPYHQAAASTEPHNHLLFDYDPFSPTGPPRWDEVDVNNNEWHKFVRKEHINLDIDGNECASNRRPSPVNLVATGKCGGNHEILTRQIRDTDCKFDSLSFSITPHSLRANFPLDDTKCIRPTIDLPNGYPFRWHAHFVEVHLRAEHVLDGRRYDGELQMNHLGQQDQKRELSTVSVMLDASGWQDDPKLQQYIDEWQALSDRIKDDCAKRELSVDPSSVPSSQPSVEASSAPSVVPSDEVSNPPSRAFGPSSAPSGNSSIVESISPSLSSQPSVEASSAPSVAPSDEVSNSPSLAFGPSSAPSPLGASPTNTTHTAHVSGRRAISLGPQELNLSSIRRLPGENEEGLPLYINETAIPLRAVDDIEHRDGSNGEATAPRLKGRRVQEKRGPRRKMFPYDLWPTIYFYRYRGQLTTPPCSEIVSWRVLDEPLVISRKQFKQLARLIAGYTDKDTCENASAASPRGESYRPLETLNTEEQQLTHCTAEDFGFWQYPPSQQ